MAQQSTDTTLAERRLAEIMAVLLSKTQAMNAKKVRIEINYSDLSGQYSVTDFGALTCIIE